jgi:4-methylaminobutanoate oxidase (formaldehyde-forming)
MRLEAETGIPLGFNPNGSMALARHEGRWEELKAAAQIARHHGIEAHLLSPAEAADVWPLMATDGLVGALLQPHDGTLNPGWLALAYTKRAHDLGVTVREGVRVSGLTTDDDRPTIGPSLARRRVTGVVTDRGVVEAETVVLAAGLWTRDLAAAHGVSVPLYAAEHVHVRTAPVEGAVATLPFLRDVDGYLYVRHYRGAFVVGAFEPNGKPVPMPAIGPDFAFGRFEPDWEHFAPVRANAARAVPILASTEYVDFLNAPESFTPDANFCLGETPEVGGLFVAAGFNSQGIIFAGGAGMALAGWIVEGAPTMDVADVDVARFARSQSNRRYLWDRTREGLGRLYAMHWPHLQPTTARGVRRTPLYERLREANACFGEAAGWERAQWFAPPGVEPVTAYAYGRQNWFPYVGEEHRTAREAVALFDLSSFAKIEVRGSDALRVVQRAFTAELDVAVGRVVYTLALNARGGIELDGTVTRLGPDRFWFVAPTTSQHEARWWLEAHVREGEHATVTDVTSGWATLAVMGPRSRTLLQRLSDDDLSTPGFGWMRAREIEVADAQAVALRVSFVGELGWELYVPAEFAVHVDRAITEAGLDLGLRRAGMLALDTLRLEKGYRHLGHDIGPADDPWQAGLGFAVALAKDGGFTGSEAAAAKARETPSRRQVFWTLEDPEATPFHGESIIHDGRVVGNATSAGFGHTLGAPVGLGYVKAAAFASLASGGFQLDVRGTLVDATLTEVPRYDPGNERLRM